MTSSTQEITGVLIRDMRGLCDALGIVPNKSLSKRQELRSGTNGSLSVVLSGRAAGSWFDHELGAGGGPIQLIQREFGFRYWRDATAWARNYLGNIDAPIAPKKKTEPPIDIDFESVEEAGHALKIWIQASNIADTPGEAYLHNRAIKPEIWPDCIRWHSGGYLVFRICRPQGRVHAIQRIYIKADGTPQLENGKKKKKRSLGPQMGRTVIFPGVDGPICIAEGPETALSIWCATGYETRAALGLLESVDMEQIPADREIILCRDDDPTEHIDSKRQNQVKKIRIHRRGGRTVLECFPHNFRRGDKSDFNDLLQLVGPEAIRDRINAIAVPVKSRGGHPLSDARTALKSRIQQAVGEVLSSKSFECVVDFSKYGIPKFTIPPDATTCQFALRVDLGVGKTEEAIRVAIAWVEAGNGPVTFAVPTHALCTELEARFRSAASYIKVATWRGRRADDPSIPDNLDLPKEERVLMCLDPDAVGDIQAVSGNPRATLCKPKVGPSCSYYPCRYENQREQKADIWIVAHHALFSQRPESIPQPSLIIIDESFWQAGLYGVGSDTPKLITPKMIEALPHDPQGTRPTVDLQAELMPLRKAILHLFDAETITANMITLTAKQCRKAAKLEWNRKLPDIIVAGITPAKRRDVLKRNAVNAELALMIRFWNTLAKLLDDGGTSGRLTPDMGNIRITGIRKITPGWIAPTLHIDGTMDLALVEPWLPLVYLMADVRTETPFQTVRQYYSRSFSETSLRTTSEIDKLWWWCVAQARLKGGVWLLIVQKGIEDCIKARHSIPNFMSIAHHNGITGRDDWKDVTGAFIVGRTAPPPKAIETIAGAVSGQRIEPLNGWHSKRAVRIGNITVDADVHPDAFAERVRHAICEAQVIQGTGRPRGANRTADKPVELYILGNLPLDIDVDHTMEWKPPSKDEVLWAKYGVWLESLGDAATILGISRTTLKSQRQREPSDDGCILYKGINIENASIVRSGTYKRTGRQYREQRIVWDSRTITDIESFLTDQLGELAILKI